MSRQIPVEPDHHVDDPADNPRALGSATPADRPVRLVWPDAIAGLGRRRAVALSRCAWCSAWSFVVFGQQVVCYRHAIDLATTRALATSGGRA